MLRPWRPNKPKVQQTLQEALRGANMLITYSSAAAVMALLEGVPVLVSAASAVCNYQNDRATLMNALADNQWTLNEIEHGKAWTWLNP